MNEADPANASVPVTVTVVDRLCVPFNVAVPEIMSEPMIGVPLNVAVPEMVSEPGTFTVPFNVAVPEMVSEPGALRVPAFV